MAVETTTRAQPGAGQSAPGQPRSLPEPAIPQEIGANFDNSTSLERTAVAPGEKPPKGEIPASELLEILEGYRVEAEYARLAGPNSRDMTWLMNLDLYWNRFDFSNKANWQAREILPEFPQYVDRFAAALRTALMSQKEFFGVQVDQDTEGDIAQVIRKAMGVFLRRIGRNSTGQRCDFLVSFEEAMKYGALMMCATSVSSKKINGVRQTVLENVDPYNIWLDPTGRGLYRIRRLEMDLNEFQALARKVDGKGVPLYTIEEMKTAGSTQGTMEALQRAEREKRTGTAQWQTSTRRPVLIHEFYGTIIDNEGNTLGTNVLAVWANQNHLIRGIEENPFWHGRDWMVIAPVLPVPGAPYGRAYVENFATICRTLNELTNLLLDAVFTSAMKAFAVVPSMLEDPGQVDEGVYPNVVFRLNDGAVPADFLKEVNLGQLPPDVMQIWQALKRELQEGAAFSDLSLGQLAPRSRTSATEIGTSQQNSNSLITSIASNIECLFLEPLLDLIWRCSIQHLDPKDKELRSALGDDWFDALVKGKKQFAKMQVTFVCRGISALIDKGQKLQKIMQLMQIVGANQQLAQVMMQEISWKKTLHYLFELFDIDSSRVLMTPREQLMAQLQAQQQAQQQAQLAAASGQRPSGAQPPAAGPQPAMGPQGGQAVPQQGAPPAAAQQQLPPGAGGVGA